MNSFTFRGYTVRYKRTGAGPPMIFLHNAGNDHRIWDHQMDFFSRTHDVFGIDLLGYGASDRPSITDYSLPFYTDLLKTFVETLDLSGFVLVGQCIGAAISLNYAVQNPDRIKSLVLFNIASESTMMNGAYGYLYKMKQIGGVKAFLNTIAPKIVLPGWYIRLELNKQYGKTGEKDPTFIRHVTQLYKKTGHLGILNTLLMNFGTFRAIDEMKKPAGFPPVMLIWGRENKVLRLPGGKTFAGSFNPDTFIVFDECGHLVMREKPDEVNRCLSDFIS